MAFFGMLIGNGHAAAPTDYAAPLSEALDTANVGEILDKLAALNTADDTDINAKAVNTHKDTTYSEVYGKLKNAGIEYDDTDYKYYLQNNDSFSHYIKTKLGEEIKAIKTGGIEDQYKKIIDKHRNTVYKQTDASVWKGKVTEHTCKNTNVDDIKNKIEALYVNMVSRINTARQEILKKLLKEKMVEKITSMKTFTEFVKTTDKMIKQYAKRAVEKIIDDTRLDAGVKTALKKEVSDGLNAAMAECQTEYNNKKAELTAKETQEISGSHINMTGRDYLKRLNQFRNEQRKRG